MLVERNGRYWLVKDGEGLDAEALADFADQAITVAVYTGSVGATMRRGGDDTPDVQVQVVELVERKPG